MSASREAVRAMREQATDVMGGQFDVQEWEIAVLRDGGRRGSLPAGTAGERLRPRRLLALAEALGCGLLTADARLGRAPDLRRPVTVVPR